MERGGGGGFHGIFSGIFLESHIFFFSYNFFRMSGKPEIPEFRKIPENWIDCKLQLKKKEEKH